VIFGYTSTLGLHINVTAYPSSLQPERTALVTSCNSDLRTFSMAKQLSKSVLSQWS
jgi:hypothetical protein